MAGVQSKEDDRINPILKFWSDTYTGAPKIYLPGTRFDICFTILSCIIILGIRLMIDFFYQTILGWPDCYRTHLCSACTTSILHAIVLVLTLGLLLINQPYIPSAKFSDAPKYWQDVTTSMLQMCTGYMCYDIIVMLMENGWSPHPDDTAFFGHHFVTILYMSQVRLLGVGHISAMSLMFTGEITNPFQNANEVVRQAIRIPHSSAFWNVIHPYIELAYGFTYATVRAFIAPPQLMHLTYDLLFTKNGRNNIPLIVSILWVMMMWGIVLGSYPWTLEAIEMVKDGLEIKYDSSWDHGPRFEL